MLPSISSKILLQQLNLLKAKSTVKTKGQDEDRYKKEVTPAFDLIKPEKRVFTDEELALLHAMIRSHRFNRLVVNDITDVLVGTPFPPVCYAGIHHGLTPFDPRCYFSLFYGCAVLVVDHKRGYEKKWSKSINVLIPDTSPNPPSFIKDDPISGAWYPSLGRGGWIAVCDSINVKTGNRTNAIVVMCNLDVKIQNELQNLLKALYFSGATVNDFFHATKWFRDYIQENKRRILYLVAHHGLDGITVRSSCIVTSNISYEGIQSRLTPSVVHHLREEYGIVYPEHLPSFFILPVFFKTPETQEGGEEETPCTTLCNQAKSIVPEIELILDDIIPYSLYETDYLRLSNSCELKGKVIRIEGPTYAMKIVEIKDPPNAELALNAYPALAPFNKECKPSSNGVIVTSLKCMEDPDYVQELGQHCHGRFPEAFLDVNYGEKPIETLIPIFVRYSDLNLYPEK